MNNSNQIKKTLVPFDFSFEGKQGLMYALSMASKNNAELILVHIIPQNSKKYSNNGLDNFPKEHLKKIIDSNVSVLNSMVETIKMNYNVSINGMVRMGSITTTICKIARDESIDLIVLGTRGKNSKNLSADGNIAQRVAIASEVPVLIVPKNWNKQNKPSEILNQMSNH